MNPTVMNETAPQQHDDAARSLPQVEGVRHRFVQSSGLRVHIAEAGEGEPVLLLHGWPQHLYAWRKVIPLLAANHRLISPDLRGFGWTVLDGGVGR